ncbi:MAG: lipopolysaccharide biosynthesis protein [Clostridiales bacterium]|nr:lipopolysaccharide biosynthesis protein [Clostridiales bacterium]
MATDIYGKKSIVRNILWKFLERGSSLIVSFAVTMILARLLDPSDFGVIAIMNVFVLLLMIFVYDGLGNALVQKKDSDQIDFSSMLWLNLCVSGVIYAALFFAAPFIAAFFGYPEITAMIRVLSIKIIVAALNSIQMAYVSKNMLFRFYFYSTLTSKIGSGVLGVIMALTGFGVWALVAQALSVTVFETAVLWFKVKWRPRKVFSWERAKPLYAFAWKVMLVKFIEQSQDQYRKMLIGKIYTSSELAFYDKGANLPNVLISNLATSTTAVMFPVLSNIQDDKERVLETMRKWISLFAFGAFPLATGIIATAKPVIVILYSAKWLPSVPFLILCCVIYATWALEWPLKDTIKSIGRADVCLYMQIAKTIITVVAITLARNGGVLFIAEVAVGCAIVNVLISVACGNRYLGYKPMMLVKDIYKTILLCILMGACVYAIGMIGWNMYLLFVIQVIVGMGVYAGAAFVTKNENLQALINLIKEKKRS